jgi:hypothetical protein
MIAVLFALALGQSQGQATIISPPPPAQPQLPIQTSMGPVNYALGSHHDLQVSVLSNDTMVVVKDVGDSQIVMVYRIDPAHKVQLVHKARFFY